MQNHHLIRSVFIAGCLVIAVLFALFGAVPAVQAQSPCGETVTVQGGDMLREIAVRCDTTISAILAANPEITDPALIHVGQVIRIPGEDGQSIGDKQSSPPSPEKQVEYKKEGQAGRPDEVLVYTVRRGDTLSRIARQFNTTVGAILAANPSIKNPNRIRVGQQIRIPTTKDNLFTRANIYLIALEDAGQSGPFVGCGDSVIPVRVLIEPTRAPLTAALKQLLALDDQFFGESGLYNALYQSDLEVESVTVAGGTATIHLSGQLVLGGVCDAPRVEAQLEQTALQFSTVDRVAIFVNGVPLASLLSGK